MKLIILFCVLSKQEFGENSADVASLANTTFSLLNSSVMGILDRAEWFCNQLSWAASHVSQTLKCCCTEHLNHRFSPLCDPNRTWRSWWGPTGRTGRASCSTSLRSTSTLRPDRWGREAGAWWRLEALQHFSCPVCQKGHFNPSPV